MLRALTSASTGMIAQQLNIDTISNNIANVNTTGYKKVRAAKWYKTSKRIGDILY